MLDLSRPEELWSSFEEIMLAIRNGLKMSYDPDTIQELREKKIADRRKELERGVDPFPMKICIIGGRYDEFKVFLIYSLILNFFIHNITYSEKLRIFAEMADLKSREIAD